MSSHDMKRSREPTPSTKDTTEKRTRAISGSVRPLDFGDKRSDDDPVDTRKPPVRFETNQPQFGAPDFYRQIATIKGLGAGYAPHLTVFADTPAALKQTGAANEWFLPAGWPSGPDAFWLKYDGQNAQGIPPAGFVTGMTRWRARGSPTGSSYATCVHPPPPRTHHDPSANQRRAPTCTPHTLTCATCHPN